jgi:Papain family cysteine protease
LFCAVQGEWRYCAFAEAGIGGGPYRVTSGASFWNPADPEVSTELILLNLAFNNGVTLGFWDTTRFDDLSKRHGPNDFLGFLQYDPSDFAESRGGHVVHVVGYVTNHDLQYRDPFAPLGAGGGYFIVKNSWGRCWGDGGYGYLPWAYVKARANEAAAVSGVN